MTGVHRPMQIDRPVRTRSGGHRDSIHNEHIAIGKMEHARSEARHYVGMAIRRIEQRRNKPAVAWLEKALAEKTLDMEDRQRLSGAIETLRKGGAVVPSRLRAIAGAEEA